MYVYSFTIAIIAHYLQVVKRYLHIKAGEGGGSHGDDHHNVLFEEAVEAAIEMDMIHSINSPFFQAQALYEIAPKLSILSFRFR